MNLHAAMPVLTVMNLHHGCYGSCSQNVQETPSLTLRLCVAPPAGTAEIVFRGRQLEGKTLAEVELQAAADLQVERVRGVSRRR